jgi:hypothetical protein
VRQLYGHLPDKPLLWTAAHGGRWLCISQCVFPDAACLHQQPFHLLTAGETQQSLLQHTPTQQLEDSPGGGSSSSSSSDGLGPLGQALLLLDVPLLDMPAGVLLMMQKHLVRLTVAFAVASFWLLVLLLLRPPAVTEDVCLMCAVRCKNIWLCLVEVTITTYCYLL